MSQIPTPPPPPHQPNPPRYQGAPIPSQVQINLAPIANNWGLIKQIALWVLYLINIGCGIYCGIKYLFLDITKLEGGGQIAAIQQFQSLNSLIFVSGFVIWLDIVVALLVYISRRPGVRPMQ